jgi:2-amino-4-hydroxy-6-hydroxymethyldihydropteridine diphosphokinase
MRQFNENRNGEHGRMTGGALIAIGANLPGPDDQEPIDTCRQAAIQLNGLPNARLIGLSRWFATAPIPPSGQPPYINAVTMVTFSAATPESLLANLQAIEAKWGRQRSVANAARSLDLDLIAVWGPGGPIISDHPKMILPHPRAHLRAFVLAPITDVMPNWRHPLLHQTAQQLLDALTPQDIQPIS